MALLSLTDPLLQNRNDNNIGCHDERTLFSCNVTDVSVQLPGADTTEADLVHLTINSDEFKTIRRLLRCLSLWHPPSACLLERIIYPMFVNAALALSLVGNFILNESIWMFIFSYLSLITNLGTYLSHLLGVLYFRSRDLDNNLINIRVEPHQAISLRRSLRLFTRWTVVTYVLFVLHFLMFEVAKGWTKGGFLSGHLTTFTQGLGHLDKFKVFAYWFNYSIGVYGIGCSLSICWIVFLLQKIASVRLKQLEKRYLLWSGTAEDAIYDHLTNYSRKISKSCNALSAWFFAHNLILAVVIPFLIYDILESIKHIKKALAESLAAIVLFILLLIYIGISWAAPLFFAERLQRHDENFISSINRLCPGVIIETLENSLKLPTQDTHEQTYTFKSRSEVNKLLSYLKSRKSGFLIGNYTFQLKLSIFSLALGLISFVSRIETAR